MPVPMTLRLPSRSFRDRFGVMVLSAFAPYDARRRSPPRRELELGTGDRAVAPSMPSTDAVSMCSDRLFGRGSPRDARPLRPRLSRTAADSSEWDDGKVSTPRPGAALGWTLWATELLDVRRWWWWWVLCR